MRASPRQLIVVAPTCGFKSFTYTAIFLHRARYGLDERIDFVSLATPDDAENRAFLEATAPPGRFWDCHGSPARLVQVLKDLDAQSREQGLAGVVHLNAYQLGPYLRSALGRLATRPRVLQTMHRNFGGYHWKAHPRILREMLWADRTVFCSRTAWSAFYLRGLMTRRVGFIANGIDLSAIDQVRVEPETAPAAGDRTALRAVTIARATGEKNIPFLLDLAKAMGQRLSLLIIGPLDPVSARRLAAQRPDNVEACGQVPKPRLLELVARSDVFLSASRTEGLPGGVLEAMALGKPVLLSAIPAHHEILRDADHDRFVLPVRLDQWRERLDWLAGQPAGYLRECGQRLSDHARRRFSLAAMHEQYSKEFADLTHSHSPIDRLSSRPTKPR